MMYGNGKGVAASTAAKALQKRNRVAAQKQVIARPKAKIEVGTRARPKTGYGY